MMAKFYGEMNFTPKQLRTAIRVLRDVEEHLCIKGDKSPEGWQPMDSAPMDGTDILLAFEPCCGYLVMAKWFEKKKGWGWVCSYTQRRILNEPTHWHLLPDQPYTEEEQWEALEVRARDSRTW